MRLRIDTEGIKFRVDGPVRPRQVSKADERQRTTPDGRPVWVAKLKAIDKGAGEHGSSEVIWVEVAGDMPELVLDELASVAGLAFDPWVNKENKIVRAFRADSIVMADAGAKSRAA
jgi:hypothetical protein